MRWSTVSSMYPANSGNAPANPSPRSVRFVRGNSLTMSSPAQVAIVSASEAGNPRRCTVTRLGSGTEYAATRSALPGTVTPSNQ